MAVLEGSINPIWDLKWEAVLEGRRYLELWREPARYWEGGGIGRDDCISKLSYLVFSKSAPLAHIMSPCRYCFSGRNALHNINEVVSLDLY